MRTLFALVLILATAPALAACPPVPVSDWARETAAQAQRAICLQAELNARLIAEQQQAQLKADYELKLMLLELEQRFKSSVEFPSPKFPQF